MVGSGAGAKGRRLGARKFKRRRGHDPQRSCAAGARRRPRAQFSPPAPAGRSPLDPPAAPPAEPAPGLQRRRSAHALRIRARSRERARGATLARFSSTSKFIHKTLTFSAQRGVSLGEEARTSCFSLLPREDEGRVPAQSLRQHQFHARTRRMCGEGVGEGERVWGRKAAPRRVGWGGVGVVKRRSEVPTLGLRSFKSVSKKGRAGKKLFQCLSLLLLGAPSAPRSRDWLLPARPLFPKCDNP